MNGDIIDFIPLHTITLDALGVIRGNLQANGWQVDERIDRCLTACHSCGHPATIYLDIIKGKQLRCFHVCFNCWTAVEMQAVYEVQKPAKKLSNIEMLQTLVDQVNALQGGVVTYKPGHGYYVTGIHSPVYFQYYDVGLKWLTEWITTNKRPSDARRRIGANGRNGAATPHTK